MSDQQHIQFWQRLRRIDENHRKLSQGYVATMNPDGLVVPRPERRASYNMGRVLLSCLAIMLAFKVYLLVHLGTAGYQDRVTALQNGSTLERVGAYTMVADPVTVWIADLFAPGKS